MSDFIKLTSKLYKSPISGETSHYWFWCPGCKSLHAYVVGVKVGSRPNWGFNDNLNSPTFTPSLLCNKDYPELRCHLFITNGKILYQNDCHHELKGKTVDLVNIPEHPFG